MSAKDLRELEERIRRIQLTEEGIIRMVEGAIAEGRILSPSYLQRVVQQNPVYSGGINNAPNSDFSYSVEAWGVPDTPSDSANPNNALLYNVYQQKAGDPIGSLVTESEANPDYPIWNKTYGVVELGSTNGADIRDIAIKLNDNPLKPQELWYLRAALSTRDDTPLPDGAVFYMGFWVKRDDATEGWLEGENITLGHKKIGNGSRTIEYLLVGKLDTGFQVKSNVLVVNNAPDVLDDDNYIELSFTGTAGFTVVDLYRRIGATVHQIAHITNSAQLHHHDRGGNMVQVSDFPVINQDQLRAYSEVNPYAISFESLKSFSDFRVRIPNFDTTKVVQSGTYLRFGLKGVTAEARQLFIDTVWAGLSYNTWSPSPLDNPLRNPASSLMTTGTPSTGTSGTPPVTPTSCVEEQTDLLLAGDEVITFKNAKETTFVESGEEEARNEIESVRRSVVSEMLEVTLTRGLKILCTENHRFIRSFKDGTGVAAKDLKFGDILQGRDAVAGENIRLRFVSAKRVYVKRANVVSLRIRKHGIYTPYYAGGDRSIGIFVFFHNRKQDELEPILV